MTKNFCESCRKVLEDCTCKEEEKPYVSSKEYPFLNAPYSLSENPSPGELFAKDNDGRDQFNLLTSKEEWDKIKKENEKKK